MTCVILLFLLVPLKVKAEGISNYFIEATVEENGNLHVKELFILEGNYNGFERMIDYKNSSAPNFDGTLNYLSGSSIYNGKNIEINQVQAIEIKNPTFSTLYQTGDLFTLVETAEKGDYGIYTMQNKQTGKKLLIYNPSFKEKKGFYIEYTLIDMAISHQDIAELGWNLFSDQLTEDVEHMEVKINIPNNQTLLRAWAHGPLQGTVTINSTQQVTLSLDQLSRKTPIDVRIAFDKEVISKTNKTTNLNVLNAITEMETKKAEEANAEREKYYQQLEQKAIQEVQRAEKTVKRSDYTNAYATVKLLKKGDTKTQLEERLTIVLEKIEKKEIIQHTIFQTIWIAWIIGLVILLIHIYKKYDKEYKSDFKQKYYRDFPDEYGPAIVGYLLHKNIQNQDLSASILHLIQKKKITFEEIPGKRKDYIFKKLVTNKTETEAEQALIDFLFYKEETITLSKLKSKAKNNYSNFMTKYQIWKNKIEEEAKNEEFYEKQATIKIIACLYCFIGLTISIGFLLLEIICKDNPHIQPVIALPLISCFIYVIAMIYIACFTKKTKKGINHYKKWTALKNFMNDFGTMNTKELPEITLWEKYLVYAVSLGCAQKLSKTMKIKIQELSKTGDTVTNTMLDINHLSRIMYMNQLVNTTMQQVVNTAVNAQSEAIGNSHSSSGSGFGGGFSGGGGSFGGGGGGGRF